MVEFDLAYEKPEPWPVFEVVPPVLVDRWPTYALHGDAYLECPCCGDRDIRIAVAPLHRGQEAAIGMVCSGGHKFEFRVQRLGDTVRLSCKVYGGQVLT